MGAVMQGNACITVLGMILHSACFYVSIVKIYFYWPSHCLWQMVSFLGEVVIFYHKMQWLQCTLLSLLEILAYKCWKIN